MRPFDLFFTFNMDRRTDQQAYFPIEMQFCISVKFLGFPNEIHREKPLFLDFENNWLDANQYFFFAYYERLIPGIYGLFFHH